MKKRTREFLFFGLGILLSIFWFFLFLPVLAIVGMFFFFSKYKKKFFRRRVYGKNLEVR